MEFCRHYAPNTFDKHWDKFFIVGCMLINQAARVSLADIYNTPCNMFLALLGKPGSGKTTIMNAIQAAIANTYIKEIPTGSAEAIEEMILNIRYGILFWDEAGELASKSSGYLDRVKYVLNKAYYLDSIMRHKTTKASVFIKAKDYYVSAVFGALIEQWKSLVSNWLGGFERRVLPLKFKKARKPFDPRPEPSQKAIDHLISLQEWINALYDANVGFQVDLGDMTFLQETYEQYDVPEEYETQVEEYTYFTLAAVLVNDILAEIGKDGLSQVTSPLSQRLSSNLVTICDVCDIYNVTYCDVVMRLGRRDDIDVTYHKLSYDILVTIIKNVLSLPAIEEDEMFRLVEKIKRARQQNVLYMPMRDFVRKILGTRNADYYRPRVQALMDAEYINIIQDGRTKFVILDPQARVCGNCRKFHTKECHIDVGEDRFLVEIDEEACQYFEPRVSGDAIKSQN